MLVASEKRRLSSSWCFWDTYPMWTIPPTQLPYPYVRTSIKSIEKCGKPQKHLDKTGQIAFIIGY